MATSSNETIQALMNEVEAIDNKDPKLEEKLSLIAQKIAEEQQRVKAAVSGLAFNPSAIVDPADAFACEGCQ